MLNGNSAIPHFEHSDVIKIDAKFSRHNIFVINLEITKILFMKLEVTRWPI